MKCSTGLRRRPNCSRNANSPGPTGFTTRPKHNPMKTNPLKDGVLTENSAGLGTVTPKMVLERAAELAVVNGRSAHEANKSDHEEAKQELTGDSNANASEEAVESAPESERWIQYPVRRDTKWRRLPATMRMTKGEAIRSGWSLKAQTKLNTIEAARLFPSEAFAYEQHSRRSSSAAPNSFDTGTDSCEIVYMSIIENRDIRLVSRPNGIPTAANFALVRTELEPLKDRRCWSATSLCRWTPICAVA